MIARPGTETYAANLALALVGVPAIAGMQVDTTAGRAVRLFFPQVRDDILRAKWWSFAKGWDVPAADPVESLGPLKKRYALPADCLRVRYILGTDGELYDDECGAWDIESSGAREGQAEQTFLVSNIEAPTVAYTRCIGDVRLWDPVFLTGFSCKLAAPVSRKLGRSRSFADRLDAKGNAVIEDAAAIDSKEQSRQKKRPQSSWLAARRVGGRR